MSKTLPDRTVPEMLRERVAASPEAPAFCSEHAEANWSPISWRDFEERATRLAAGLLGQGLRKGDRLALIAPVSLDWELLHHAALRTGLIVVGLDVHDLPTRLAAMCDTADITAVATTKPALLAALAPERCQRLCCVIAMPGSDSSPPPGQAMVPMGQLLQAAADGAGATANLPGPSPGSTATIIFTSGTTGDPKGIAYTHAQICLAIEAISDAFPFVGPGSRLLCWLPLSNLFQRMVNLAGMRRGAAAYLLSDPRRVMDVVAKVSPDIFIGVPRFYEKLYQGIQARIQALPPLQRWITRQAWITATRAASHRLKQTTPPLWLRLAHRMFDRAVLSRIREAMGSRLRCMVTGSAPTPEYLLREFHALGWLLLESYGLSENVLPMAMNRVGDFKFGTVGRPVPGNDIRISSDGVIAVRGPGVFSGYLGKEDITSPLMGEYFETADIGSFDEQGYLRLFGRCDEIVKSSTGKRIQLNAIEAALRGVPGITDALAIANGIRFPIAVCTTELDTRLPVATHDLEARLATALARLPADHRPPIVLISDKPFSVLDGELTSNLKVRRRVIEQKFESRIASALAQCGDLNAGSARSPVVMY